VKRNLGRTDRTVRLAVAVVLAVLYFTDLVGGTLALIMGVVGLIMLFTAATGFCSFYLPFGIDTRKRSDEDCRRNSD